MTIVYMRNRQLIAEMHRPVIATHGRAGRGCGRAGAETEAVAGAETEAVAWAGPLAAPVRWPAGQIGSPRSDEVWTGRRRMHPRTWLARAGAGATAAALCAGTVIACAAPPPRLLISGIVADRAAPDGIRTLPAGPAIAGSPKTAVPAPPAGGTLAGRAPAGGTPAGSSPAGSSPAGGNSV